jgi:ABC-type Co2+ transport system permease subunit
MRCNGPFADWVGCMPSTVKNSVSNRIRGVSHMTSLVALSVSITIFAFLATLLALGPLAGVYIVWIGFFFWALFFATGGNMDSLKTTIISGIWGVICGWLVGVILTHFTVDLPFNLWPAIVVSVMVLVLCLGAHVKALSNIPVGVIGFASVAGVMLMSGNLTASGSGALTAVDLANPLIFVSISVIIGTIFGLLSGKLAGALGKS